MVHTVATERKKTPESFAPGILETSLLIQKLAFAKVGWFVLERLTQKIV